jgi:AraC-like DNA-binding protein
LDAGLIVIVPPNTAHELSTRQSFDFCALRIDADQLGDSPLSDRSERVAVAAGSGCQALLSWLCNQLFEPAEPDVHKAAVLGALAVLLSKARETGKPRSIPEPVARMIAHIRAHLSERVTSSELGQVAELSHYHAARTFRRHIGVPPHEYQTILRVERAKALLATGMSVSEAANSLGFTDQSHLHRYFKRYVRVTPGEYRRWSATEGKKLHAWPGPAISQASAGKGR